MQLSITIIYVLVFRFLAETHGEAVLTDACCIIDECFEFLTEAELSISEGQFIFLTSIYHATYIIFNSHTIQIIYLCYYNISVNGSNTSTSEDDADSTDNENDTESYSSEDSEGELINYFCQSTDH